ncbi:MAG TPA: helix-turn-helix domain-containing protein [Mycobacteriales bacterium]|nr:helix-turn-helix domain-containing protein [Mycobacteriales bacterium]
MRKDPAIHHIAVLALPRVVAFDLTVPVQVFGQDGTGRYAVTLCTAEPGLVPTTSGFGIEVRAGLGALRRADTVIVPGYDRGPVPAPVVTALQRAYERGARISSICTGAFALAAAGILDGRRVTTHWQHAPELAQRFPQVRVEPAVLYVDDGPVHTSAGVAAGIDLCLHLFALDHGEPAAVERARRLVSPLHRAGGQAQFIAGDAPAVAAEMAAVTEWAAANLHRPITVADLARRAMQSPRTFTRRFQTDVGTSPHAWLTRQRLRLACRLLEDPAVPIDEVAERSGMGSAANFRLHFRRAFDTTPTTYRAAFTG